MTDWTRRDILKTGLAAAGGALTWPSQSSNSAPSAAPGTSAFVASLGEPGQLAARGYKNGTLVPSQSPVRVTTTTPTRVALRADRTRIRADGEDVAVITAEAVQGDGVAIPIARNEITFTITGSGRLIGVGNGDPSSHESDKGPARRLFSGLCCAIVQSTKQAGELRVEASSPGLESASVSIACAPAAPRPTG